MMMQYARYLQVREMWLERISVFAINYGAVWRTPVKSTTRVIVACIPDLWILSTESFSDSGVHALSV